MKGRIELYYDMPHLEAYLKASGANYDGSILKDVLDEFIKEAVLHHIEENKFTIMGTLNNFLENKELFIGSRELFRRLPKATEDIFFDTDKDTLLECSDYLVEKERPLLLDWQTTGKHNEQKVFRTTADVCFEKEQEIAAQDNEKDCPIIFLDFDGVLNTEKYYCELKSKGLPSDDKYGQLFDPEAVANLRKIIDATDARIVVSSSWRYMGLNVLQRMWYDRDLPGRIVDITPLHLLDDKLCDTDLTQVDMLSLCRGNEIKWYFDEVLDANSNSRRFVIFDDLKEVLPELQDHFIRIDPIVGITEEDVERAVEIMNA
ncbi:MAG: hypothetical protein IKK36_11550 [Bacteroidales bacterium]|nr:hypothetical protein [Bacteroidales bacterium]MBR3947163.1 hypothetical protein [Bacteroidales bacterium]